MKNVFPGAQLRGDPHGKYPQLPHQGASEVAAPSPRTPPAQQGWAWTHHLLRSVHHAQHPRAAVPHVALEVLKAHVPEEPSDLPAVSGGEVEALSDPGAAVSTAASAARSAAPPPAPGENKQRCHGPFPSQPSIGSIPWRRCFMLQEHSPPCGLPAAASMHRAPWHAPGPAVPAAAAPAQPGDASSHSGRGKVRKVIKER